MHIIRECVLEYRYADIDFLKIPKNKKREILTIPLYPLNIITHNICKTNHFGILDRFP